VINGAGIMKSRFAWHARKCRRESPFVELDPLGVPGQQSIPSNSPLHAARRLAETRKVPL
jgi:hypothetical protein